MCSGIRYPHLATEDAKHARRSLARRASQLRSLKVGFPIRRSPDQSLFAAPRGLSQRTTSFIASQRQGIHQMPFSHFIRSHGQPSRPIPQSGMGQQRTRTAGLPPTPPQSATLIAAQAPTRRTSARQASTTIHPSPANTRRGGTTVQRPFKSHETCPHRPRCGQTPWSQRFRQPLAGRPRIDPTGPSRARPSDMPSLHDDSERARQEPKGHPGRKAVLSIRMLPRRGGASPDREAPARSPRRRTQKTVWRNQTKSGGARRDRTDDLMLAKHALSQLSYGPDRKQRPSRRRHHHGGPPDRAASSKTTRRRPNQEISGPP